MARLSDFRSDTHAIQDGAWVRVNEAVYSDLEILTRGYTDDFVDAQKRRFARAADKYGGDQAQILNSEHRAINASLAREYLVLDVRNLLDDDGQPVTYGAFLDMLEDPAFMKLARAVFEAAGKVTTRSAEQIKAAVGNFRPDSAGT